MYRVAIALLALAGCSEPAQKQTLLPPPLPADIAMRLGGTYESSERVVHAYKAAWMDESSSSEVVIGVIDHPDRRLLWTVVGFDVRNNDAITITMINGNGGVFEPEVETRQLECADLEFAFQDGWVVSNANDSKATRKEKTSVIPDPGYVLITPEREYHFRQRQDPTTAAQIDALFAMFDACAAK